MQRLKNIDTLVSVKLVMVASSAQKVLRFSAML
jgi:hypothetical protein